MSFRRVLIANRGEIAFRIMRTCEKLGIETVLAASEADLDSMAARTADHVICIGAAAPSASYLNVDGVIAAAVTMKADAIHPGYGFLSENPNFCAACEREGIAFIGPTVAQLDTSGDKLKARAAAVASGLPVISGGEVRTVEEARQLAQETGWPALVKSVGGGGGRGIRLVHDPRELEHALALAMAEAQAGFGDARVYLESFIARGRHVEVQILGDGHGVIHLGTRDCSIQRRYQKVVEEAPAPGISENLRGALQRAAVAFAGSLHYRGAGTVEMLVDCEREAFFFLEMNARLQVEHPVTEEICGLDLVEEQINIAEGRALRWKQSDIVFSGHAIECRINAEDWTREFQPSPGMVSYAALPAGDGVRVDSHIQAGTAVPRFYDSLLGKIIARGTDRADALRRMRNALKVCEIGGVNTNLQIHSALLEADEYERGAVDTGFLQRFLEGYAIHAA